MTQAGVFRFCGAAPDETLSSLTDLSLASAAAKFKRLDATSEFSPHAQASDK
ncbi:MAG: hypothetical protein AB8E87_04595 [Prochlorococcus sp.]